MPEEDNKSQKTFKNFYGGLFLCREAGVGTVCGGGWAEEDAGWAGGEEGEHSHPAGQDSAGHSPGSIPLTYIGVGQTTENGKERHDIAEISTFTQSDPTKYHYDFKLWTADTSTKLKNIRVLAFHVR